MSESIGSGVAVGSGTLVGSGMAVGAGVGAGAQAAKTRAITISNIGKTVKRFIFFTPIQSLSDFCTYFAQIMFVF
jgi:hypothetical protein